MAWLDKVTFYQMTDCVKLPGDPISFRRRMRRTNLVLVVAVMLVLLCIGIIIQCLVFYKSCGMGPYSYCLWAPMATSIVFAVWLLGWDVCDERTLRLLSLRLKRQTPSYNRLDLEIDDTQSIHHRGGEDGGFVEFAEAQ